MLELTPLQRRALRGLQRTYGSELPARAAEVAEAAFALGIGRGDRRALQALRHLAHRLAGSAAICGFPDVGELARRIEDLAVSAGGRGEATREVVAELRRLSRRLRRAAA